MHAHLFKWWWLWLKGANLSLLRIHARCVSPPTASAIWSEFQARTRENTWSTRSDLTLIALDFKVVFYGLLAYYSNSYSNSWIHVNISLIFMLISPLSRFHPQNLWEPLYRSESLRVNFLEDKRITKLAVLSVDATTTYKNKMPNYCKARSGDFSEI